MISIPQFFRVLADRTRLRIVNLLARGPLCVCNIQHVLGQPQSSVSRHLGLLRASGLTQDRRVGMRTFYELTGWDGGLATGVLDTLRRQLKAQAEFGRDLEVLAALKTSGRYHHDGAETAAEARRASGRVHVKPRAAARAAAGGRVRARGLARAER